MGFINFRKIVLGACLAGPFVNCFSQPFVDLINASFQSLNTTYRDSTQIKNTSNNAFLNLTLPVKLDSLNTIVIRFYGENLASSNRTDNFNLSSAILPLGYQRETKNHKWKYVGLVMPKLSGHLKEETTSKDFQLGGYGLVTWVKSENFKVKLGLFYNREFFGNFFVPLFAVDWKVSDRFQMYGVLPNNYRLEYAIKKQVLYAGLAFKSYTRSYHISLAPGSADSSNVYVRNNEIQAKAFVDLYLAKRYVLFAEFGRTINYSPRLYWSDSRDEVKGFNLYSPIKDNFFFNVGLAYRIRFDF